MTTIKIAANAVRTGKIADDAVTTDKLADNAVTTGKIADDAVTGQKVNVGSVHCRHSRDESLAAAEISRDRRASERRPRR